MAGQTLQERRVSPLLPRFGDTHRVLERQETVADPAAGGPIPADVGESLVQVAVRGTKGDFFDGLVYQQVLEGGRGNQGRNLNSFMYSFSTPLQSALCPVLNRVRTPHSSKQRRALLVWVSMGLGPITRERHR